MCATCGCMGKKAPKTKKAKKQAAVAIAKKAAAKKGKK